MSQVVLKDPQTSVDRIDDLARRIIASDILLPKFQRAFVWERKRILGLLDSIAKGYPIGSILLWRTRQELKSERKIAQLPILPEKEEYPYNYLLDGQQRLSTICGALFWSGNDANSDWNIAYDLREQKFMHLDTLDDLELHLVRVNRLANPSNYFEQVALLGTLTAPDKDELKARAQRLFDRFKDYKVATVTLGDMEIEDVAPIFERINSQGKVLTRVDLMRAATWSKSFDLIDEIENIRSAIAEKGFGQIDDKTILRGMAARHGAGFAIGDTEKLRKQTVETLTDVAAKTRKSYTRAVDFLVTQIGVQNGRILPYTHQLMFLAEVMGQIKTPTAQQYEGMKAWFWQTSISGYFSGWNSTQMKSDFIAIAAFAAGKSTALPVPRTRPTADVWRERPFRSTSALCKVYALILAQYKPRDLLSGLMVDTSDALSWENQKEFHHFFPRRFVAKAATSELSPNTMANMVFLTSESNKKIGAQAPSLYLKAIAATHGNDLAGVFASNLIPSDAYAAALNDDYDAFLAARASAIDLASAKLARWPSQVVAQHLPEVENDSIVEE